jgi:hypothetical protein
MKHTVCIIFFAALLHSAPSNAQCRGDDQPYGTRCISKQMSDYLACVESTGGNRSAISSIVQKIGNLDSDVAASAALSTRGRLVNGSASIALSRQNELSVLNQVEAKFFVGGASTCSEFAQTIKSRASAQVEPHFPIERTLSGDRVVFFGKFIVQLVVAGQVAGEPATVELDTPENGRVNLKTGEPPIDVSFNGVDYRLSARESDNRWPIRLVLNR